MCRTNTTKKLHTVKEADGTDDGLYTDAVEDLNEQLRKQWKVPMLMKGKSCATEDRLRVRCQLFPRLFMTPSPKRSCGHQQQTLFVTWYRKASQVERLY